MKRKGFTLVELLAVIVILGLILMLAVPKIMESITKGREGVFEQDARSVFKSMETKINNVAMGIDTVPLPNSSSFAQNCPVDFWGSDKPAGTCKYTFTGELSSLKVQLTGGPGDYKGKKLQFDGKEITKVN